VILVLTQATGQNLPRYQDEACDFLREVKPLLVDVNRIEHVDKRIVLDIAVTVVHTIQLVLGHQDGLYTVL
jgi:hypothetical protein